MASQISCSHFKCETMAYLQRGFGLNLHFKTETKMLQWSQRVTLTLIVKTKIRRLTEGVSSGSPNRSKRMSRLRKRIYSPQQSLCELAHRPRAWEMRNLTTEIITWSLGSSQQKWESSKWLYIRSQFIRKMTKYEKIKNFSFKHYLWIWKVVKSCSNLKFDSKFGISDIDYVRIHITFIIIAS